MKAAVIVLRVSLASAWAIICVFAAMLVMALVSQGFEGIEDRWQFVVIVMQGAFLLAVAIGSFRAAYRQDK